MTARRSSSGRVRRNWDFLATAVRRIAERQIWMARRHRDFCQFLRERHGLAAAAPVALALWNDGAKFYRARDAGGAFVFIKFDGAFHSLANEIEASRRLSPEAAPSPRFACLRFSDSYREHRIAGFEWLDGQGLDSVRFDDPAAAAAILTREIPAILGELRAARIIHRDLIPRNLMVCAHRGGGFRLVLIDFAFAVFDQTARAGQRIPPRVLAKMGGAYKPETYRWDDAYALDRIVSELAAQRGLPLDPVHAVVSPQIGKWTYAQDPGRPCL